MHIHTCASTHQSVAKFTWVSAAQLLSIGEFARTYTNRRCICTRAHAYRGEDDVSGGVDAAAPAAVVAVKITLTLNLIESYRQ